MEKSPFSALSLSVHSHWIPTHQISILINTSRHSTSLPYHSPTYSRYFLRCPSNEATATGSTVLCAALSVCTEWPEYAPATAAIRLALKAHLQFLSPGALCSSTSIRAPAELQSSLQVHQASERVLSRYSVRMPAPRLLYAEITPCSKRAPTHTDRPITLKGLLIYEVSRYRCASRDYSQ